MENKYTLEELEAQYREANEKQKLLKKQIEQKKREEEVLRNEKLAAEKASRKKEVDDAIAQCKKLLKEYMHDYGIYSFTNNEDSEIFSTKLWNWIW